MGVNPDEDEQMSQRAPKARDSKPEPKKNPVQVEAIRTLLDQYGLVPGDRVYTKIVHVSRSGMYRVLDLYIIRDGVPLRITRTVAEAIGARYDRGWEGLGLSGCGMDMGSQAVYLLGFALWPNGTPVPHGIRNGEPDSDGGYALKQSWL